MAGTAIRDGSLGANAFDGKRIAGQAEDLAAPSSVVSDAEGDVDESDVEPEKPSTGQAPIDTKAMPTPRLISPSPSINK